MTDNNRELALLQLADQMSTRGEWCGAAYLQALSYLLDLSSDNRFGFSHYWYRGGPYSSLVAETLETLRDNGFICHDPVVLPAGPSYRCTSAADKRLPSGETSTTSHLIDAFLNHPGKQRLLLARATYALTNHSDKPLEWLEELGAKTEEATESLNAAKELLASRCRPAVAR